MHAVEFMKGENHNLHRTVLLDLNFDPSDIVDFSVNGLWMVKSCFWSQQKITFCAYVPWSSVDFCHNS